MSKQSIEYRPDKLPGKTYKIKINSSDGNEITLYLTITDHDGKPFEMFITCKDARLLEHLSAYTVAASRLLRKGEPVQGIIDDLLEIHSPFTQHHVKGEGICPSLYARIGGVLQAHVKELEAEASAKQAATVE